MGLLLSIHLRASVSVLGELSFPAPPQLIVTFTSSDVSQVGGGRLGMRLAVDTMGHAALGERERAKGHYHPPLLRLLLPPMGSEERQEVQDVSHLCSGLLCHTVPYQGFIQGEREGKRSWDISTQRPVFIPPSPARSWPQYMQHISET